MKGGVKMKVEIREVNKNNEVIMWNPETDEILKKQVSDEVATLYREELKKVKVIQTVFYEEEKERLYDKEIPKDDEVGYKFD